MHVYKFTQAGAKLDLQGDTFEQLKPGLSSFADDPQAAADSLQPLLQTALATVPEDLQARRPCVPADLTLNLILPATHARTCVGRRRADGLSAQRARWGATRAPGCLAQPPHSPASGQVVARA